MLTVSTYSVKKLLMRSKTNKKTEYHHGDLRQALVAEAAKVLRSEGLDALTLRDLARKLGVSHTAPYRHFKSRDDLLIAIASESLDQFGNLILDLAKHYDIRSDEFFNKAVVAYYTYATENPERFFLIFKLVVHQIVDLKKYPEFKEKVRTYFHAFFAYVEEGQRQGHAAPGDPSFVGLTVWSMIHGVTMLSLSNFLPNLSIKTPWKKDIPKHLIEFLNYHCPKPRA